MKKLIAIFAVAAVMTSCTNGDAPATPKDSVTSPAMDAAKTLDTAAKIIEAKNDTAMKMIDTAHKMLDKAGDKMKEGTKDAGKMVEKAKEAVKH